jgi:AraC-like DNA-binding protein
MTDQTPTDAHVHIARVSLRTGSIQFAASSAAALDQALAGWCRDCWSQERVKRPELSATPSANDREVIEEYFTLVDTDFYEGEPGTVAAIADPAALSHTQLADAYRELDALTRELSIQRAALARLLLRKIEAHRQPGSQQHTLSPQARNEAAALLLPLMLEETERETARPRSRPFAEDLEPAVHDDAGLPERSDEEIAARIRAELPRRRFERRVRWSVAQLERIAALNDAASEDPDGLRQTIAENARRLIAARRAPHGEPNANHANVAQVAYLMGVEVLVDLDEQRVTRVVAIDESLDLDVEEGARNETTLGELRPERAAEAIAIAESHGPLWPATEFGF